MRGVCLRRTGSSPVTRTSRGQGNPAAGQTAIAEPQENLGGAAAGEVTMAGETTADTALMAGGTAAVISSVVISMLIVADVTAGAL